VTDSKTGQRIRVANKAALPGAEQHLLAFGDCDGGIAYTIFQIHPTTDTRSALYEHCSVEALTASRKNAAKCALEMAQRSIQRTGDLSSYTGEWVQSLWVAGKGRVTAHPKSDERLLFAKKAKAKHPYTLN